MRNFRIRYLFSIVALTAFLLSCNGNSWNHGKFEIVNKTGMVVDSVRIMPDTIKAHYISLMPGEVKQFTTDMGGPGGTDGAYCILYKMNSVQKTNVFGYYSNGCSLEDLTKITIMPDTVLFQFIY